MRFRKREMNSMPLHCLNTFFKILAYCVKIELQTIHLNPSLKNRQNIQHSIHEATKQGVSSGNRMSRVQ